MYYAMRASAPSLHSYNNIINIIYNYYIYRVYRLSDINISVADVRLGGLAPARPNMSNYEMPFS